MDDGWSQMCFVTACHSKMWSITDTEIVNFVLLFSACLPARDQFKAYRWKRLYFCNACQSETIPTVEGETLSVWVLFGAQWLADMGAGGHRIQQWWSVTHNSLNRWHICQGRDEYWVTWFIFLLCAWVMQTDILDALSQALWRDIC